MGNFVVVRWYRFLTILTDLITRVTKMTNYDKTDQLVITFKVF